ncbi:hypothetical protein QFZ23_001973 [Arthrobacter globiformis]|uniref:hypothetical protein n=1 Tax=Arthrobacter globiformis TaxID=1665 RepID=UPI00278A282A|nr:hypothetical protein [Arthrobacter globiformis]MDQ1058072.1 hypothetical protein [Arthrobacter globiformis]
MIKDTSRGFIISFEELLRRGQDAAQSLQIYQLIAAIFIILDYTLSKIAEHVEIGTQEEAKEGTCEAETLVDAEVTLTNHPAAA